MNNINPGGFGFNPPPHYGAQPVGVPLVPPQNPPLPRRTRFDLRRLSMLTGLSIIAFLIMSYAFSGIIVLFADDLKAYLKGISMDTSIFSYILESLLSVFGIGLPFYIAYRAMRKKYGVDFIPFSPPESYTLMLLMIGAAFAACLLGSSFTSFLTIFLEENFGITSTYTMGDMPVTFDGKVLYFVRSAILPAFIEEFALRGVVMQPLRRYGNSFAIIVSSIIFAIMHGNLIQAPFAFIAGIALGYAVIITNSIWTGVVVHLLNNSLSVILMFLTKGNTEAQVPFYVAAIMPTIIFIGLVCFVIYLFSKKYRKRLDPPGSPLVNRVFLRDYVTTLPLLVSIISLIVQTALTVQIVK